MRSFLGALPAIVVWGLPLVLSAAACATGAANTEAWRALFAHPQLWPALGLSLFTGLGTTGLATAVTLLICAGFYGTGGFRRLQALAGAGLALPHLAFAIGFGFLIMPSGPIARLLIGGGEPPHWASVQDPRGLALLVALTLKEIPFLLTAAWSVLSRGDALSHLDGQCRAARALGHGAGSVWLRIVQPQLLSQMRWPLLIVFAYAATVVDMALVLGPTQPPVLAVVIWRDLNDAEQAANLRGLAGTLLLTAAVVAVIAGAMLAGTATAGLRQRWRVAGPSQLGAPRRLARLTGAAGLAVFAASFLLLALLSMAPRWPYPGLVPPAFSLAAWDTLIELAAALRLSIALAAAAAAAALLFTILWLETMPERHDRWLTGLALLSLVLPQIALAAGQYRLFLFLGLAGTRTGLFLGHLLPSMAYVAIVLAGPYRRFDQRYARVARSLGFSAARIWFRVKAPLLKAPLLTAAAVGFAVSMVQFVPAQLLAAGRFTTLPMEAVTLASGGDRSLTAAFALALTLPPLIAFILAAWGGRPRWA